jgi:hypothetical protein
MENLNGGPAEAPGIASRGTSRTADLDRPANTARPDRKRTRLWNTLPNFTPDPSCKNGTGHSIQDDGRHKEAAEARGSQV